MRKPLVRACRVVQMPDQFTRWTIYLEPFKVVKFFAREIIDLRSDHHRNVDASAVENFTAHDRPPVEAPTQAALFERQWLHKYRVIRRSTDVVVEDQST